MSNSTLKEKLINLFRREDQPLGVTQEEVRVWLKSRGFKYDSEKDIYWKTGRAVEVYRLGCRKLFHEKFDIDNNRFLLVDSAYYGQLRWASAKRNQLIGIR